MAGVNIHRPSIVLELPGDRWMFCLVCQQPWPCKQAGQKA